MTRFDPPVRMAFLPTGRRKFLELSLDWSRTLNVTPVVWFGDNHLDEEVSQLFPACEIVPQSLAVSPSSKDFSTGFAPLSAEELERYFQSIHYRSYSHLVAAEYDRFPRKATLRGIDREAIVRRLAQYMLGIFTHRRPEFFLAAETPHNALGLMALAVCSYLEVPTLFFQPTSSVGPNMVPRSSLERIFTTGPLQSKISQLTADHAELSHFREDMLVRLLEGYGGDQTPPRFVQQQKPSTPNQPRNGRAHLRFNLESLSGSVFPHRVRALLEILKGRNLQSLSMDVLFNSFREEFLRSEDRLPESLDHPKTKKSALFGLHYQPERTSIPEGPLDFSQLDSVLRARRWLPTDIHLFVKEHPSQVAHGRTGYLGRSHHFYEFLQNVQGITMVGSKVSVFEILDRVSLTFTLTGTLGIQSVLRSIPVVYFGNPWWQELPGSYRFDSVPLFDEVQAQSLPSRSKVRAFLRDRILNQSVPGFSSPSQEKSWGIEAPDQVKAFKEVELAYFRAVLETFLETGRK